MNRRKYISVNQQKFKWHYAARLAERKFRVVADTQSFTHPYFQLVPKWSSVGFMFFNRKAVHLVTGEWLSEKVNNIKDRTVKYFYSCLCKRRPMRPWTNALTLPYHSVSMNILICDLWMTTINSYFQDCQCHSQLYPLSIRIHLQLF